MVRRLLVLAALLASALARAQQAPYVPLDESDPVAFYGDSIAYGGRTFPLSEHALFVDGSLSDETAARYPYVYNSLREALEHLSDGTPQCPMTLYIAPYVYWTDDPDDPQTRLTRPGDPHPFGMTVRCEWLRLVGLNRDPRNVVVACNRGQTIGAIGNFTMFRFYGDGLTTENITLGNYCNVDLEFPLRPALGRAKRSATITQAQISMAYGDRMVCRNTRFISRLNLCPMVGCERIFFERCHFETTDDALNPRGVYLDCTFDFYGSRPTGGTDRTGMVFLDCRMRSFVRGEQYLIKSTGTAAAVDTRMEGPHTDYFGWRDFPDGSTPYYYSGIRFNGCDDYAMDSLHADVSIDITERDLLDAFCFDYRGRRVYNVYNLLCGDDGWDPAGMRGTVAEAERLSGKRYSGLPTRLLVEPAAARIETGGRSITLQAAATRFGVFRPEHTEVEWSVDEGGEEFVELSVADDGACEAVPRNLSDDPKRVVVRARTASGLEAACVLEVAPEKCAAPHFRSLPRLKRHKRGLSVDYLLDTERSDRSQITWYRCTSPDGADRIETAVSRMDSPTRHYRFTPGDAGYYILAEVAPRDKRSDAGEAVAVVTQRPVSAREAGKPSVWEVDLQSLPTGYRPEVREGFWSADSYAPYDTEAFAWEADNSGDAWFYGHGFDGARDDVGLVQKTKGARLRYTPAGEKFGDMKITLTAVPAKRAGQGFSSARAQYMDIYIGFDHRTMSGYALRLVRTTKHHDAIDFVAVRYDNGRITPISDPVSAACYRPECRIEVALRGHELIVHADSPADYYVAPERTDVVRTVDMRVPAEPTGFGGFGFQHTGTVGSGSTLIKELKVEWK